MFEKIKQLKKWQLFSGIAVLLLVIVLLSTLVVPRIFGNGEVKKEITTVSTLEKIINVSELSTFSAVYNGIAKVNNSENPDEIDYYVSYEAKIKAGIDFEKVNIDIDKTDKQKKINIIIPKVHITKVNVDISSLDFIFLNQNANSTAVTEQAYKVCNEDAQRESENQKAIYELAEENAKSIVKALVSPLLEQLGEEYELVVTVEE